MQENNDQVGTAQATDSKWMSRAIEAARQAELRNEVPVGAVVVDQAGQMLAMSGNSCIAVNDPTGHAEMHALREAGKKIGNYRLVGTTMYVTLEPCLMCAAAMIHARVNRVVFGAADPKSGALHSVYNIGQDDRLNHRLQVTGGVLAAECSQILKDFFLGRR
jgi:tRNA(adenine34) deaminase